MVRRYESKVEIEKLRQERTNEIRTMGKFDEESPLGIALIVIAIVIPGTFQSALVSIRTNGKLLASASRTLTTKLSRVFLFEFRN